MSRRVGRADRRAFWVFVGPLVVGLAVFGYLPIGWSLLLSFFDAHGTVTPTRFVGLANYADLLRAGPFLASLGVFTLFALLVVPLTVVVSLGLALLVHQVRFARAFVRSVYFLPAACSYVVAALVWKLSLFNGVRSGLANTVLGWFGGQPVAWTATSPWYWAVLVSLRLWLQVGFYLLLFLAGLRRVPRALYEAAWLDGANPGWRTFRHVTLPQLRGTLVAVLLLNLIAAYQSFDEFYNVLGTPQGYPPYARPPLVYLYYSALGSGGQDFGHGSAGALLLAVLIAVVTLAQGRLFGTRRADR